MSCKEQGIKNTFRRVGQDGETYEIALLNDDEELFERGAPSADVRDRTDTHTHAMDRKAGKAAAVRRDDSAAELIAEAVPDVSADSRYVELL